MLTLFKTEWIDRFDPDHAYLKQAIRTSLGALVALIIYRYQSNWTQGYWIVLSAAFLMQTRLGDTQFQQAVMILISTIFAAILSYLVGFFWGFTFLLACYVSITTFIAVYLTVLSLNIGIATFFINLFIIMSAGIVEPSGQTERLLMIMLGGFIAFVMSWLWPTQPVKIGHQAIKIYFLWMSTETYKTLRDHFNLHSIYLRRALRTSIAIFISILLYRYLSIEQGFWVPLTVVIVMQATTAATLRKGLQRFLGTVIGIIIGSLLVMFIKSPFWIDCLLIVFLFIAYYLKAFNQINYGIFVVPITIMVVFLVSALVPEESHALILARLYDTSLGALIGVIITFILFPNSLSQDVNLGMEEIIVIQFHYLNALCDSLLQKQGSKEKVIKIQNRLEQCLAKNRRFFQDWRYELWLKFKSKQKYENFLVLTEKLSQYLFSIHHLAINAPAIRNKEYIAALQTISEIAAKAAIHHYLDIPQYEAQLKGIDTVKTLTTEPLFISSLLIYLDGYKQCLYELEKLQKDFH